MGTGFLKRKKEAKALQNQLMQMQSQMETVEVQGSSGGGLVEVNLSGDGALKSIRIKPECVDKDDVEGLQDLIKAAFLDGKKKLDEQSSKGMSALKGLPGFNF